MIRLDNVTRTYGRSSQAVTGSPVPSVPMAPYALIVAVTVALAPPSVLITGRRTLSRSDHALAG
jgi:hypothetical protein